jgi:hypothetical protein
METITKEKIEIAPELLEQINTQVEKQVIVHGIVYASPFQSISIRLWPTINLLPKGMTIQCKLIKSFNVSLFPKWQEIALGKSHRFTLVFEGLPADCKVFDLVEIIPEPGGFEVRNIKRNEQDVYEVEY